MSVFNKDVENRKVRKVPVSVPDLRELRRLAEVLTRAVQSNGRLIKDDKIIYFTVLGKMKKTCDGYLQLELFSDAQLAE